MTYRDFLRFHPNAKLLKDGRTINAILRKAAKILNVDWKEACLYVDSPYHYVNYNHAFVSSMSLSIALTKVEHKGKSGFDLVYVDGCFCPYVVSYN